MGYYARPDLFPIHESYALIRGLQPQALIAFKQGATGDEDFASPERHGHSLADRVRERIGPEQAEIAEIAWARNQHKHNEICDTLQPGAWGYTEADDGQHRTSDEVQQMLADAQEQDCNLLLNTGPLPDGSIHHEDIKTLREVGRRIRGENHGT
jgi:alpha-L-fucosidase